MPAPTVPRRRVLVISHDVVSQQMAGPGIRYLELARVLAAHVDVTLATPNASDLALSELRLHPYPDGDWARLAPAAQAAEVIITPPLPLAQFPALAELGRPLVIDLYDPFPLENLLLFEHASLAEQQARHQEDRALLALACAAGDFFLCAQPRQRDWWLGLLQGAGRINPLTVAADPTLRALIDEVPFGLPSRPFAPTGPGPKATLPGLTPEDKLILWGGGLWDWLDPLTLIRAMPTLLAQEPRARLLFPGTRHPNPTIPDMEMARAARALADEVGLLETHIFFGDWVPYEAWPATLRDADLAVSLHFNTLESDFAAVRSRILGYLWARRPMVVSAGDAAARLVAEHGLGAVVPPGDVAATSAALARLLAAGPAPYAARFAALAESLRWEQVAAPLIAFCQAPRRAPDHALDKGGEAALFRLQRQHIAHLEAQVRGYEQGRVMRLLRTLDGWARRWPR